VRGRLLYLVGAMTFLALAVLCMGQLGFGVARNTNCGQFSVTGVNAVVSTGGGVTIDGSGFTASPPPLVSVSTSSGVTSLTGVTFVNSTRLTATAPALPASSPSFWPMTVTLTNSCSLTEDIFMVNSVQTPGTTLGSNCLVWLPASSFDAGVGDAGIWTDLCQYHQNAAFITEPPINNPDTNFNSQTTLTFDGGANSYAITNSFSLEGGHAIWCYTAARMTAFSTADTTVTYAANDLLRYNSATALAMYGKGVTTDVTYTPGATLTNDSIGFYGYEIQPQDAGVNTLGILQGLGPPEVTTTYANTAIPDAGVMQYGKYSTNQLMIGQIAEIVCANVYPPDGGVAQIAQYEEAKYLLASSPSITGVTAMQSAGNMPVRAAGSNFSQSGTMAGGTIGSFGATTCRQHVTTETMCDAVEGTVPSGTYGVGSSYDVTITNADLFAGTLSQGLSVAPYLDPWAILGDTLIGWQSASNVTCSGGGACSTGSTVTSAYDQSQFGNTLSQATTLDMPTWNSSNAAFGGAPTIHFSGGQWLAATSFYYGTAWASGMFVMCAVEETATPSSSGVALSYANGGQYELRFSSANTPNLIIDSTSSLLWTGPEQNTAGTLYGYTTTLGSGSGTQGINWENGTEQTKSYSGLTAFSTASLSMGARTDGTQGLTGDIAECIEANAKPSSTLIGELQTYFHTEYGI
jgi:hypothetical protein